MIGVHHRDEGGGGGAEALDRGAGQSAAADALDDAQARVGETELTRFLGGAIGGIVIHHQHFPARRAERSLDPLDQRRDVVALVERREHDGEFERRHGQGGGRVGHGFGAHS